MLFRSNDTATTEIYTVLHTLSLHDALQISVAAATHGEGDVVVHFPGGDLRVRLDGGRATLTGPAVRVE